MMKMAAALYDLIWKSTIASQMSDAEFEKTTAQINISTNNESLAATGEVMKFDGFLKVYNEGRDDEDEEDEAKACCPPCVFLNYSNLEKCGQRKNSPALHPAIQKLRL